MLLIFYFLVIAFHSFYFVVMELVDPHFRLKVGLIVLLAGLAALLLSFAGLILMHQINLKFPKSQEVFSNL